MQLFCREAEERYNLVSPSECKHTELSSEANFKEQALTLPTLWNLFKVIDDLID